jgi:hypothetical protein
MKNVIVVVDQNIKNVVWIKINNNKKGRKENGKI